MCKFRHFHNSPLHQRKNNTPICIARQILIYRSVYKKQFVGADAHIGPKWLGMRADVGIGPYRLRYTNLTVKLEFDVRKNKQS